jgi:hypothetical protein
LWLKHSAEGCVGSFPFACADGAPPRPSPGGGCGGGNGFRGNICERIAGLYTNGATIADIWSIGAIDVVERVDIRMVRRGSTHIE